MRLQSIATISATLLCSSLSASRVGGPSNALLERMVDSSAYSYNVSGCVGEFKGKCEGPETWARLTLHYVVLRVLGSVRRRAYYRYCGESWITA